MFLLNDLSNKKSIEKYFYMWYNTYTRFLEVGMSNFFAYMSRMKYIKRWSLMRSTTDENILEHSAEVALVGREGINVTKAARAYYGEL